MLVNTSLNNLDWSSELPTELWFNIFHYLSQKDRLICGLVSQYFLEIAQIFWEIDAKNEFPIACTKYTSSSQNWRSFYWYQKLINKGTLDNRTFSPTNNIYFDHSDNNPAISISENNILVVSRNYLNNKKSSLFVKIWDLETRNLDLRDLPPGFTNKKLVKVIGKTIYAAQYTSLVEFEQNGSSRELASYPAQQKATRLCVENHQIALGHSDGTVRIWEDVHQPPQELPGNKEYTTSLLFDGSTLLVGGAGGTLRIVDFSQKNLKVTHEVKTGSEIACMSKADQTVITAHKRCVKIWKLEGDGIREEKELAIKLVSYLEAMDHILFTGNKKGVFNYLPLSDLSNPVAKDNLYEISKPLKAQEGAEKLLQIKGARLWGAQLIVVTNHSANFFKLFPSIENKDPQVEQESQVEPSTHFLSRSFHQLKTLHWKKIRIHPPTKKN